MLFINYATLLIKVTPAKQLHLRATKLSFFLWFFVFIGSGAVDWGRAWWNGRIYRFRQVAYF